MAKGVAAAISSSSAVRACAASALPSSMVRKLVWYISIWALYSIPISAIFLMADALHLTASVMRLPIMMVVALTCWPTCTAAPPRPLRREDASDLPMPEAFFTPRSKPDASSPNSAYKSNSFTSFHLPAFSFCGLRYCQRFPDRCGCRPASAWKSCRCNTGLCSACSVHVRCGKRHLRHTSAIRAALHRPEAKRPKPLS